MEISPLKNHLESSVVGTNVRQLTWQLPLCLFLFALFASATSLFAQNCPSIAGTYRMYEVFQTNRYVGGQADVQTGTTTNSAVDVYQIGDTFTIFPGDPARMWTGTLLGNKVVSITGEILRGSILNAFAVETNAVLQSSGNVYSTQMVMYISGRFSGTNYGIYHRYDVQRYIYLYGTFHPLQAPQITSQPASLTATAGSPVTFSVEATGATPLSYQWRKGGIVIANATDSNYTIAQAQSSDAGAYTVQITNIVGSVTSRVAQLVLNYPPRITVQPVAVLKRALGARGTLTIGAAGTGPLSYQWRVFGTDLPGATNNSYTFAALPVNGETNLLFSALVSNPYGSIISSNATVVILRDTNLPVTTITSPLPGARINTGVISGTATDNAQITNVSYWVTNLTDGSVSDRFNAALIGSNLANLTWRATNTFHAGSNVLAVCSQDLQGNTSKTVTRPFFYKVAAPFTLTASGNGTGTVKGTTPILAAGEPVPILGTTNLFIGQPYTVQARPNVANSFFTNWTTLDGSPTNATLTFIMRPGMTLQANFVTNLFIGMAGTYTGLFCDTNGPSLESMGAVRNFILSRTGAYTGQLLLKGVPYQIGGNFDMGGHAQKTVARPALNGGPVRMDLYLDWSSQQLFGTVAPASNSPAWHAELLANVAGNTIGCGQYTAVLPPPENVSPASPGGFGYLTMTNKNGNVSVSGLLADGTPIAGSVPNSKANTLPIYSSLYAGAGLLWGWLDLSTGSPAGELFWIKKKSSGLYAGGFTNCAAVVGSPWHSLRPPVLPFTTNNPGLLQIMGNSPQETLTFSVAVLANNTLVKTSSQPTNSLTGTVDPKTGVLKLSFAGRTGRLSGSAAILQNQTNAFGAFCTRTNSGAVLLGR